MPSSWQHSCVRTEPQGEVWNRLLELLHHALQSNGGGRNNNEDQSHVQVSLQRICMHDHIRYPQTVIYRLITRLLNLIRLHSNDTIGLTGQSPLNNIWTQGLKITLENVYFLSVSALPEMQNKLLLLYVFVKTLQQGKAGYMWEGLPRERSRRKAGKDKAAAQGLMFN